MTTHNGNAAILGACRRQQINSQDYLMQLLANLPDTRVSQLDEWLPDQWKAAQSAPPASPPQ